MTQNKTMSKVQAAVAEYKYVWTGNRTKSLSDFVQVSSELKKLNCWKSRGPRAPVPHSWRRQRLRCCHHGKPLRESVNSVNLMNADWAPGGH